MSKVNVLPILCSGFFGLTILSVASYGIWRYMQKEQPLSEEQKILIQILQNNPQNALKTGFLENATANNVYTNELINTTSQTTDEAMIAPDYMPYKDYRYSHTITTINTKPEVLNDCESWYLSESGTTENFDYYDFSSQNPVYLSKTIMKDTNKELLNYYLSRDNYSLEYIGGAYAVKFINDVSPI